MAHKLFELLSILPTDSFYTSQELANKLGVSEKTIRTRMKELTGKELRHSHASYLINVLQKDILYVARRMGHADKSTTLNTYSHWFNALDKTVSEEITQNVISAGLDSILCQNPCQTHN